MLHQKLIMHSERKEGKRTDVPQPLSLVIHLLQEMVKNREAWGPAVHGVGESQRGLSD